MVEMLMMDAKKLENTNPKDALAIAENAYEIAKTDDNATDMAWSLILMGRCLGLIGKFHEAVKHLNEALEISKTLKSGVCEGEAYNALGNVQSDLKIFDNAINYFSKGLKIAKKEQLENLEADILSNIGTVYSELHNFDTALSYYLKVLEKCKKTGDKFVEAKCTYNTGVVYYEKGNFSKSREYTLKSLEISKEEQDRIGCCYSLHFLAIIERHNKNYKKSYEFFKESLVIATETGDIEGEIDILIDMSELMIEEERFEKGLEYLHESLRLSENIDGNTFIAKIYSHLAKVYKRIGNVAETMYYYEKFHDATNDTISIRREEKLRTISFQLELDESQQETETYRELMKRLENRTSELYESYSKIKVVSEIGQSLTATLDLEKIFNRIYENINKLMDATVLGVGLYNVSENCIEYKLFIEKGKEMPLFKVPLTSTTSFAAWAFNNKQDVLLNDAEKEYSKYSRGIDASVGNKMPSSIFYPLIVEDTAIGVLTVQSENKHAYENNVLDTLKIFVSYIAIAINNAQNSEKLAEEIKLKEITQKKLEYSNEKLVKLSNLDGLTNIPNRRFFDKIFEREWNQAVNSQTSVSILLIDIDYFKEYNDNYGHLEGDKVLQQIAKGIENITMECDDVAARYGGDEFIALLKNTDKAQALEISVKINEHIKHLAIEHSFATINDYVTLSIGVATATPNDDMKGNSLIDKADEALYLAKRSGRNRSEVK